MTNECQNISFFVLLLLNLSAKPQVLLVGQYSVGKTSFIRYLLGRDFPGQRIGPEPTTDRFTVLINGPEERTIPGNALSVHPDLPFRGLERFGVSFLSRFEGSQLPSSVLRSITLVDTPVRLAVASLHWFAATIWNVDAHDPWQRFNRVFCLVKSSERIVVTILPKWWRGLPR